MRAIALALTLACSTRGTAGDAGHEVGRSPADAAELGADAPELAEAPQEAAGEAIGADMVPPDPGCLPGSAGKPCAMPATRCAICRGAVLTSCLCEPKGWICAIQTCPGDWDGAASD